MAKTLVYEMYPIAWKTGLKGMTEHISRVSDLGVDYIWLSPLYLSPRFDHGYDVADYKSIDPRFGTMADFDNFVNVAHKHGIGVLMDLVLNHTSTGHEWFREYPDLYCWSKTDREGWHNLFDDGSAWEYDEKRGYYYLHLFHPKQADLCWFYNGGTKLNQVLVDQFRKIVKFWTEGHGVDGFRLDVPQSINKNFAMDELRFTDLLFGDKAIEVLNAIFPKDDKDGPFLMMECFDPTYGQIVTKYYKNTAVDYVLNVLLKDKVLEGDKVFNGEFKSSVNTPGFMLDFESHDSMRFPSRGIEPENAIWRMFNSDAEAICLYQGQELGLLNPSKEKLPDWLMLWLDAQTKMQYEAGGNLDELRLTSRANARVPIPLDEYARQEEFGESILNFTKGWIERWKMR